MHRSGSIDDSRKPRKFLRILSIHTSLTSTKKKALPKTLRRSRRRHHLRRKYVFYPPLPHSISFTCRSHSGSLSPTPLRLKRRMVPPPPSPLRIHFWRPTRRKPAKRPRLRRRGHRARIWFRRGRFRRCQLWMSD